MSLTPPPRKLKQECHQFKIKLVYLVSTRQPGCVEQDRSRGKNGKRKDRWEGEGRGEDKGEGREREHSTSCFLTPSPAHPLAVSMLLTGSVSQKFVE